MIEDEELGKIVYEQYKHAEDWQSIDLAESQASNIDYYNRKPFGNEKDGFSKVVTADVMETVEGIMPDLMKIFASGDNAVEFEPTGKEDVAAAEQATDYVNHVFMNRMDGFTLLYSWFKDALLMKNGLVKVGWEEADTVEFHTFKDATAEEIEILEAETSVEEVEIEDTDSELLFDLKVKRVVKGGKPFCETIPNEEFFIRERSKSIASSDFHCWVSEKSLGELISAGYDVEEFMPASKDSNSGLGNDQIKEARFNDPKEGSMLVSGVGNQKEDRLVDVIEGYIRIYDTDSKSMRLMRTLQIGDKVLESEEVNRSPFVSISPILMPHKFTGIAVADLVRDIQEINSTLWRQMLDNLTLSNAGRYAAVEGQVNLKDLLDNKIGGIVRMKAQGAVQRLDTPNLSPFTVEALDRLQEKKETRVGVSKMQAGLDPNALTSHTGTGQLNTVMSAAQGKIQLIARIFAETGVKDLFSFLYEEIRTHETKSDIVKLRGTYTEVSPFDWVDRKDMTVTVGIGNSNKDQQAYHLQQVAQTLQQVGNTKAGYLISEQNIYNLAADIITNSGYKNADKFITSPEQATPPEPVENPEVIAAKAEAEKDRAYAKEKVDRLALDRDALNLKRDQFLWDKKVNTAETILEQNQKRPVGIGD
jgi:hypothetical protein